MPYANVAFTRQRAADYAFNNATTVSLIYAITSATPPRPTIRKCRVFASHVLFSTPPRPRLYVTIFNIRLGRAIEPRCWEEVGIKSQALMMRLRALFY